MTPALSETSTAQSKHQVYIRVDFQVGSQRLQNSMESAPKKVLIQTWGCQMNVADSERMLTLLAQKNYKETQVAEDADLIILNTCHIREKAKHKVLSRLGELAPLKTQKPNILFAVSGCVAQAESKSLKKEAPFLDLVFGPDQIEDLSRLLDNPLRPNGLYS